MAGLPAMGGEADPGDPAVDGREGSGRSSGSYSRPSTNTIFTFASAVKRIARPGHDVRDLPGLQAAQAVRHAQRLGRVEGDRPQGRLAGQALLDGLPDAGQEVGRMAGDQGERARPPCAARPGSSPPPRSPASPSPRPRPRRTAARGGSKFTPTSSGTPRALRSAATRQAWGAPATATLILNSSARARARRMSFSRGAVTTSGSRPASTSCQAARAASYAGRFRPRGDSLVRRPGVAVAHRVVEGLAGVGHRCP